MSEELNKGRSAIERAMKSIRERGAAIERLIASHGEACFEAPCGWRDDQYLIVHPCTRPGHQGKWQASFFDAEGASGRVIGPYNRLIKDMVTHYKLDPTRIKRIEKPSRVEAASVSSLTPPHPRAWSK
jgi:hypothetical protein